MAASTGDVSNLRICHVNCQSLVAHLDEFRLFFSSCSYHIICLSETWLSDLIDSDYVHLNGYSLVRCDRRGKRGGGVGAFVHHSLQVNLLNSSEGPYSKRPEFLFLEVIFSHASKLLLGVIYRPPKTGFWEVFEDTFHRYYPLYKHTAIMGDFNTDLHATSFDRQHLMDFLRSSCLHLVPFDATHHTATSHTLLDLCFVDDEDKILSSHQEPVPFLSAHDLIEITYKLSIRSAPISSTSVRDFRNFNIDRFLPDLEAMDWTSFLETSSIEVKLRLLNDNILCAFDSHAPFRRSHKSRPPAPWLSQEIKLAIRERNKLRKKFQRTCKVEHWVSFKKARNQVKRLIRDGKRKFYTSFFSGPLPSGEIWSKLRQLGLVKRKNSLLPPHIDLEELNTCFSSISRSAALYEAPTAPVKDFNDRYFYFKDISPTILLDSLRCLRSNACGIDGLTAHMIKTSMPVIFPYLLHLFNFSLSSSRFPSLWKSALVRPVPKCRNPVLLTDFRPISILCALSKPLEKIVTDQLRDFLEKEKLLDPYQSAYRRGYSTQSALLRITDDIRCAVDNRMVTIMVLFDFSKAFDRVGHSHLIAKLDALNLSSSALSWFASYISDHEQAVLGNNDARSSWTSLTEGVPQGSILGPLLFSIYVNDLRSVIKCNYNFYADDLQIYLHCKPCCITEAIVKLNSNIENICKWATSNGLLLNSKKTKAIIFGSLRYVNSINSSGLPALKVQEDVVTFHSEVTLLGVTLTSTLNWKEHTIKTVRKINKQLHVLKLNRELLTFGLRRRLITALILPHIDYCCVAFTNITGEANLLLQRAMNNGVRFVLGISRFEHISPSYHRLGWLKVHFRRLYFLLTTTHRLLRTCRPGYLHERLIFASKHPTYETRTLSKTLNVPHCRTTTWQLSFIVTASREWNALPEIVRNIECTASFKSAVFGRLLASAVTTS